MVKSLIPVRKPISPILRQDTPAPRVHRPKEDCVGTGIMSLLDLGDGWMTCLADGGKASLADGGKASLADGGKASLADGGKASLADGERASLAAETPSPAVMAERGARREVTNASPILVFIMKREKTVQGSELRGFADDPVEAVSSGAWVARGFWGAIVHPLRDICSGDHIGNNIDPVFPILTVLDGVDLSHDGDKLQQLIFIGKGGYPI